MKKYITPVCSIIVIFFLSIVTAQGQVIKLDSLSYWKNKLGGGLAINQAYFSPNWKSGGSSSVGLNAYLNASAHYEKNNHSWSTLLEMRYGFIITGKDNYQKTADRIYFDSKYQYALSKNWSSFASINFLSQFSKGYITDDTGVRMLVSDVFSPAYLGLSLGMIYHPLPYLQIKLSPFSPRLTMVGDVSRFKHSGFEKPYGVIAPNTTRFEPWALRIVADFDKELVKNLTLTIRYIMFGNYETLAASTLDHRLDLRLVAKVFKFIDVILGGSLIYDYDQDIEVQFNTFLGLGVVHSIQNYKEEE